MNKIKAGTKKNGIVPNKVYLVDNNGYFWDENNIKRKALRVPVMQVSIQKIGE